MFKYLEDVATADVAFEAKGKTLEEVFADCALATFEAMVDTQKVKRRIEKSIELENDDLERLLFDWLAELIYLKDSESLAFSDFSVRIEKNQVYHLKASALGETIDQERHELQSDVKAVTYHLFKLVQKGGEWTATVVLDI